MLTIHQEIKDKLSHFIETDKIPNIVFHGNYGSGKRTIVNSFINNIYNQDNELIKKYVMYVDCGHGKGIKFIREELKFFAKTNTNIIINEKKHFKTIILSNADKLTIDAQSALRRCIELFTTTTRFFIIVEDKYKLLKPILSRLCDIYISDVFIKNKTINLYEHAVDNMFDVKNYEKKRLIRLKKEMEKYDKNTTYTELMTLSNRLYEKGYSGNDLTAYIEQFKCSDNSICNNEKYKYQILLTIHKIKSEFRNEKLLMFFILKILFLSSEVNLENISFM
jgi:DNA polymerase III delta prime subunit